MKDKQISVHYIKTTKLSDQYTFHINRFAFTTKIKNSLDYLSKMYTSSIHTTPFYNLGHCVFDVQRV